MKNSCNSNGVPRMNCMYIAATKRSGQSRDMRAIPVASPHSRARQNASSDTATVSIAPCSKEGRNWIMSASDNNLVSLPGGRRPFSLKGALLAHGSGKAV